MILHKYIVFRVIFHHKVFTELDFVSKDKQGIYQCELFPETMYSSNLIVTKISNSLSGKHTLGRIIPFSSSIPLEVKQIDYRIAVFDMSEKTFYYNDFTHRMHGRVYLFKNLEMRSVDGPLLKREELSFLMDQPKNKTLESLKGIQFVA